MAYYNKIKHDYKHNKTATKNLDNKRHNLRNFMYSLYESKIIIKHTVKIKKRSISIYSNTLALKCNKLLLNIPT